MRALTFAALAMLLQACPAPAQTPEKVRFARIGEPSLELLGYLFRPAGDGPFPAIVALHGCGGLFRNEAAEGTFSSRHADWAGRLVAAGYVVLFPDSFGSRGHAGLCSVADRGVSPRDRAVDAMSAAKWLASLSYVDRQRLGLMGWSNGGSSVLWTVTPERAIPEADFKVAVALYPGCRTPLERSKGNPRQPLTILIGAADDWTPPEPCEAYAKERGARIVLYPDAYHGFDAPNSKVRLRKGLAFTKNKDGKAHVGTNEAARAAAITEVMSLFDAALKPLKP